LRLALDLVLGARLGVRFARLLGGGLHPILEDGVLHHLFTDQVDQLHARELKQLDRLLQLGGHHQLLAELEMLLDLHRHQRGPSRSPFLGRSRSIEFGVNISSREEGVKREWPWWYNYCKAR